MALPVPMTPDPGPAPASWRDVAAVPGFVPIFVAQAVSTWGDYVARLAIAAVVFSWTRSPLATSTTLAVSLLPTIFGRSLLSPLVDRLHYRTVILLSALARTLAVIALILAVDAVVPLSVLLALLFLLELFGGPAATAAQVMWAERIADRRVFVRAMGLTTLAEQVNQALGFAVGGLLVAAVGVRTSLVLDLLSFAGVALVMVAVVRDRPTHRPAPPGRRGLFGELATAGSLILGNPVLGRLLGLSILATLAISAPEAIAIPYAGGGRLGGVLMSGPIAGAAVGILVVSRWPPVRANRRIIGMALLMPVPLLATAFAPGIAVTWLLWFVSGCFQAFMLPLQSTFTLVTPQARRGSMVGIAGSVSVTAAGLAFLLAGWLTEYTTPYAAVTICAVVCLGGIVLVAATWPRRALDEAVEAAYGADGARPGVGPTAPPDPAASP